MSLKPRLFKGLSEPEFYDNLVNKFKKIDCTNNCFVQLFKIISHYKKIGYNIYVLRQTACLVINPIKLRLTTFLFACL